MAAGKRIIVRYSDEDYDRILSSADAMGLTVSDYMRLAESTYARARSEFAAPRVHLRGHADPGPQPQPERSTNPSPSPDDLASPTDGPDFVSDDDYEPEPFDESELADIDIPPPPGVSGRGPVRVGRNAEAPADYDEPPPSALSIRRAQRKMGRDWVTPPDQRDYLSPNPRR